ncbi:MAG: alpha/beta hydrolase [Oscillospiraceae bacterium]|nr:alpha/beta hydrolase [Oscillospiraceae bacterium]
MSAKSLEIRAMFQKYDDIRDAGLTDPPGIRRFDDIQYGSDPVWHKLDVYRPAEAVGKLPVIVSFHGGAWAYGDKERYQYYGMELAQQGFAVVNYTYRLTPEFQFPAPLEDTNLVFAWILAHAEEYGLDTAHIFAVGDSAGAQGIALYSCMLTNPAYAAKFPFKAPEGLRLQAVALNCGLYSTDVALDSLDDFLAKPEDLALLSVIDYITADFPPAFIMTSNEDFLQHEPEKLLPVLERCGIPYQYRFCGTDELRLGHVFHCDIRNAAAKQINKEECEFFRSLL